MSYADQDENMKILQSLDDDSLTNISEIMKKLKRGNENYQNKLRGRKLRQRKQMQRRWKRLLSKMRKMAIQQAKSEYDAEKREKDSIDLYRQEELLRREKEAQIAKDANELAKQRGINLEIDIEEIDEYDDDENENLIKGASKNLNRIKFLFLQNELDDSLNKFMLNVLFGDAFKKINHQQSELADKSLKKCVTDKVIDRAKMLAPIIEGATQKHQT